MYVENRTHDLFEDESTNVDVAGNEGHVEREECEWMDDLVVRIKKKPVDRGGDDKYWQEVEQTTRVSDAGARTEDVRAAAFDTRNASGALRRAGAFRVLAFGDSRVPCADAADVR